MMRNGNINSPGEKPTNACRRYESRTVDQEQAIEPINDSNKITIVDNNGNKNNKNNIKVELIDNENSNPQIRRYSRKDPLIQ